MHLIRGRHVGLALCVASVVLLVGCERKAEPETHAASASAAAPAAPAVPERAQPALAVRHDGELLEVRGALAYPSGVGWEIELSTHPMRCSTESWYRYRDGEVHFSFVVMPTLQADGSQPWRVHSTYFGGMNVQGTRVEASVESLEAGDEALALTLGPSKIEAMRAEPGLELEGALSALRCPQGKPRDRDALAPSPSQLALVVAGKRFDVRGATLLEEDGKRTLRLSSEPHDCDVWPGDALALDLRLGADERIEHLFMRGDVLDTQLNAMQADGLKLTLTPGAGDTVEVALSGEQTIFDFAVSASGAATARLCQ